MKDLILASQSPRRKELLSLYTADFTVCVSDFDEDAVTADTPARLVEQLARGKCLAVAKEHPGAVVLGCDTVVDVNGEVFGKPHSPDDARRMLRALSGATHYVHTGVCVSDGTRTESFVDTCKVTFFPLSEEEIERYAATEERKKLNSTPPPRNPTIRPVPTPSRAVRRSGWMPLRGIITPLWACPSAGRSACLNSSDSLCGGTHRKMKNTEKLDKTLEKTLTCGYNRNVLFCDRRSNPVEFVLLCVLE